MSSVHHGAQSYMPQGVRGSIRSESDLQRAEQWASVTLAGFFLSRSISNRIVGDNAITKADGTCLYGACTQRGMKPTVPFRPYGEWRYHILVAGQSGAGALGL